MDKKATIYDIAREAGVSTATVTRVTSGSAKVKSSTRERVQRIIDAHGYVPSAAAHALESGQTHTIGLVMPSITNPYFARMNTAMTKPSMKNLCIPRCSASAYARRRSCSRTARLTTCWL